MICHNSRVQIHCEAQAKHNIVGARTEKRRSDPHFAGLEVMAGSGGVTVIEGGPPTLVGVRSTVPVLCPPQDRARGDCCLSLELALTDIGDSQRCAGGDILDRVRHSLLIFISCFASRIFIFLFYIF